jgi:salicylate hydroxylase
LDLDRLDSPECNVYKEFTKDGVLQVHSKVDTRAGFGAPWLLNHRVDLHNELRILAESELPLGGRPAKLRAASRVASIVESSAPLRVCLQLTPFPRIAKQELSLSLTGRYSTEM